MYADILNGLIFDAVYGSWILSLPLFTLGFSNLQFLYITMLLEHLAHNEQILVTFHPAVTEL